MPQKSTGGQVHGAPGQEDSAYTATGSIAHRQICNRVSRTLVGSAGPKAHGLLTNAVADVSLSLGKKRLSQLRKYIYKASRAEDAAEWVKVPGTKPDGPRLIPQNHRVEAENQL